MAIVLNSFLPFGSSTSSITLVGSTYVSNAASGVSYPSGTSSGDIGIFISYGTISNIPPGWTSGTHGILGLNCAHGCKVLNSTDISTGFSFSVAKPFLLVIYRGGTSVSVQTTTMVPYDPDTSLPISSTSVNTSFTKNSFSKKLIGLFTSDGACGTLTAPWDFKSSSGSSYHHHDLDSSGYTNGSTITMSWTTGSTKIFWAVYEIT